MDNGWLVAKKPAMMMMESRSREGRLRSSACIILSLPHRLPR
jgi:hypothetical protein